jgi:hypothetical protein
MSGTMRAARALGKLLGAEPIPEITPAAVSVRYPVNRDMWPPEVWEEMERIRKGERDGRA